MFLLRSVHRMDFDENGFRENGPVVLWDDQTALVKYSDTQTVSRTVEHSVNLQAIVWREKTLDSNSLLEVLLLFLEQMVSQVYGMLLLLRRIWLQA